MLRRIDRIVLRVPHLQAAVRYYSQVVGLTPVKQDQRVALLRFPDDQAELFLHADPDLPAEAVYYRVDDVRRLYRERELLKLQFAQAPVATARGYRAAIRDPFGNVLLIVDRSVDPGDSTIVEEVKPPGVLFAGIEPSKLPSKQNSLIRIYVQIGRTADDLPYTPDFEELYATYAAQYPDQKPTREEVWRHLLNVRKGGKLPRLGEARSRPPDLTDPDRLRLLELLGDEIGRRDRLPYTARFDRLVDEFNRTQSRPISPHLVWRLVATLAK